MKSKMKAFSVFLLMAIVVSLFASCANNDTAVTKEDSTKSSTSVENSTQTAKKDTESKAADKSTLAISIPLTGNLMQYGISYQNAIKMAVDEFNAAGGLNGTDVVLKIYDDKGDQKEAINIANKIASDDDVFAVVGSFGSSVSMAAAPVYEKANIPFFSPNTSHPDFPNMGKMMFPLSPTAESDCKATAEMMYERFGGKDVAILHQNTDHGLTTAQIFNEIYTSLGGKVVAIETFVPGQTKDFTPLLSKIKEKKPGILFAPSEYNDAAQIILQSEQIGFTDVQFVGQGQLVKAEFSDLIGDKGEGIVIIGTTPVFLPSVIETAGYDQYVIDFINNYNKLYPKVPADGFAATAYDAAKLAMHACKDAGSDPMALLEEARKLDIPLASGTNMRFEPNNVFIKGIYAYTIKNGEFVGW